MVRGLTVTIVPGQSVTHFQENKTEYKTNGRVGTRKSRKEKAPKTERNTERPRDRESEETGDFSRSKRVTGLFSAVNPETILEPGVGT